MAHTTIHQFLTASYKGTGLISVWANDLVLKCQTVRFFQSSELTAAANFIETAAKNANVYTGLGLLGSRPVSGRGKSSEVTSVARITLDLDILGPNHSATNLPPTVEDALELLGTLPTPSSVLHTGGGLLVQWNLSQAYSPAETAIAQTIRGVQQYVLNNAKARGWTVDNTADLARVVRVPGTFNRKNGGEVPVRIISEENVEYQIETFSDYLKFAERPAVARTFSDDGELSAEEAAEILDCIPGEGLDYQTEWLPVLWCLYKYAGDAAQELAAGWTNDWENRFASFENAEYSWTLGTLIFLARKYGWQGRLASSGVAEKVAVELEDDYDVMSLVDCARLVKQQYVEIGLPGRGKRVLCVRSSMGTGKSVAIAKIVREFEGSVLVVGHRISLLRSLATQFGIQHYQDLKGKKIASSDRLAITLDSLTRVDSTKKFDLVIIDEVEQVLGALATSETMRHNRRNIALYLESYLRRSDKIIVSDADLGSRTIRYLTHQAEGGKQLFNGQSVELIVNTYRKPGLTVNKHASAAELRAQLVADFTAGKKVFVTSNSKEEVNALAALLKGAAPTKRVMAISSDNSLTEEIQTFIGSINENLDTVDALICSPSLGTGVSINREYFDATYLLAVAGVNTHNDLAQQIARVRNPRDRVVHAFVQAPRKREETNPEVLARWAVQNFQESGVLVGLDAEGRKSALEPQFLQLWADVSAGRNRSLNTLAESFYAELENIGHTIVEAQKPAQQATEAVKAVFNEVRETAKTEAYEAVINAPNLNSATNAVLKEKQLLTAAEKASTKKYWIKTTFGVTQEELTPAFLKRVDDGLLGKVQALAALRDSAYAKRVDQAERRGGGEVTDHTNLAIAAQLRARILQAAGVDLSKPDTEIVVSENFVSWVQQAEVTEQIKRVLGITVTSDVTERPLRLVGAVLAQLGLALKTKERGKGSTERRYRVLDGQVLAELNRYVDHHLAVPVVRVVDETAAPF